MKKLDSLKAIVMKNVIVSVDFGPGVEQLLEKASEWAKAFGAKAWVVHIAAPHPEYIGYAVGPEYIRDIRSQELKEEHRLLDTYCKTFQAKGIAAEAVLVKGATKDMMVAEAQKLNADLIICGHQEHNFIYKAILGSFSESLIQESKIPVLLIPLG